MSFFTAKTDEQSVKDSNFEYINKSGIYDVKIKFVSVKTNAKGARSLDFNLEYKGSEAVIYGLKLDNNDGSANFQREVFNKLCVIAGIEEVSNPVEQTHILGKDKTPTNLQILDDFTDFECKVFIKYVYSVYNEEIKESREIRSFYRSNDGATASEIIRGENFGTQLGKDMKYADTYQCRDKLTTEQVEAWKKDKTTTVPRGTAAVTTSNPFAK
ncbi:hypothetical protein [Campylobacter fetus]|uniref:hypothetical protein n=1 Tax=Campylobacter fetus TaxID=196 RepID=UPI000FCC9673|nr:hypothetical protein [Campylobacter fetus]RUT50952.1 hypothetical protein BWK67_00065 [Campylobacter fetus]